MASIRILPSVLIPSLIHTRKLSSLGTRIPMTVLVTQFGQDNTMRIIINRYGGIHTKSSRIHRLIPLRYLHRYQVPQLCGKDQAESCTPVSLALRLKLILFLAPTRTPIIHPSTQRVHTSILCGSKPGTESNTGIILSKNPTSTIKVNGILPINPARLTTTANVISAISSDISNGTVQDTNAPTATNEDKGTNQVNARIDTILMTTIILELLWLSFLL